MKYSDGKNYKAIAVCLTKFYEGDQAVFIENFNRICKQFNYKVFVFSSYTEFYLSYMFNTAEEQIYKLMDPEKFDAVVIMTQTFKKEGIAEEIASRTLKAGTPCISIAQPINGCINVGFDFQNAFEQVVRHVMDVHGPKHINFIAGMKGNVFSDERLEIYKKVLTEHNIPIEEDRIGYGDFWEGPTSAVMDDFLSSGKKIDAIICANDYMAMEACSKLVKAGYRVPDDVIVSGFDGTELERYHYPRLCTAETNTESLSRRIGTIIDDILHGRDVEKEYTIDCKLKIGQSCGCNRSDDSGSEIQKLGNKYFQAGKHDRAVISHTETMYTRMPELGQLSELSMVWPQLIYFVRQYFGGDYIVALNTDLINDHMNIWPNVRPGALTEPHHYYTEEMQIPFEIVNGQYGSGYSINRDDLVPHFEELMEKDSVLCFMPIYVQESTAGYIMSGFSPEDFEYFKLYSFGMNLKNVIETHKYRIDQQNLYSTDQLTKLLNRRGFYRNTEPYVEAAIKNGTEVCVISIDMNWLKQINDTYGHKEGDFALSKISEIMQNAAGEDSVCTRFGGDEFAIAFAALQANKRAEKIMQDITKAIDDFNSQKVKKYPISVSMGYVSHVPDDNHTIERYIVEADRKMYKDKARFKETHSWEGIKEQ